MSIQRSVRTAVAVAMLGLGFAAVDARAADEPTYTIVPSDTDPAILDTPSPTPGTRGNHLVWRASEEHRVDRLLVFLPTGGPTNLPSEFKELGTEAARLGYDVVFLAYRNEAPIAALPTAPLPGCGPAAAAPLSDPDCAIKIRKEILTGDDSSSPIVSIDEANSIENRLNKLMLYLDDEYDGDNWDDYIETSGEPVWKDTVLVGSSLGAGQAALIAEDNEVYRVALLHGWVDAQHGWVERDATPKERYFTLIHGRDNFFVRTCHAYHALDLVPPCPLAAFPTLPVGTTNPSLIENHALPFDTQIHVFNIDPFPSPPMAVNDPWHASTSRDGWIARETGGTPNKKLVNAWRSVLGDKDADTWLDEKDNCKRVVNDQIDTDGDGIGDACDTTTIHAPGHVTADATGPAGAIVPYSVTVTDANNLVCTPATGSLFAIGATTVTCTANDSGENKATASFTVTVLGANEQLASLVSEIVASTRLSAAAKAQLTATLRSLVAGLDLSKPVQRAAACVTLRVFTALVRFVAPTQATAWTADANRIRVVLAC